MRPLAVFAAALAAIPTAYPQAPAQNPAADPVLQAMRDEIERSRQLTVSNLASPYFIQYLIDQEDSFTVSASLGGLVTRRRTQFRAPQVQVRVGDYSFDNTNFGGGFGGSRYDLGAFPTENAYPEMRRYLWLQTDMAYKSAVEALSRKRAAARGITQNEQINDFAHAEPVRYQAPLHGLLIDEDAWANRVRALSALFTGFPDVVYSTVDLDAGAGGYYIANSEGTEVRAAENVVDLRARAMAQAADGMSVADAVVFHAFDAARLPADAELRQGITDLAHNVVALAHAPKGEDYAGPVLFEGMAGPQIFAELLGRNLSIVRRPLGGGGGRGGAAQTSELEGRIGAKVLPDSFDVVDDPLQKEWRGRPLFGSYDVDREGVIPKPLHLVEKGVLKGFLLTRQPVRGFEGSNGRARLPGPGGAMAAIGNLFVSSSDTVPAADLKKKLIELIQARNRPYGILVRKMDFPSAATGGTGLTGFAPAGGARPISAPILVYRIYPDGREELVRGLRFRNADVRSLRDILAAGDDSQVFEFLNQGTGFTAETCVVAPSILIDDLELYPAEQESPKPPIVPAPEMTR
ncbi:MAG: metallopeptidase TldD-related protein [Bryobacteraceae bacterium]